jgi:hypothetical protein
MKENKISAYLLYAVGEILLVVIGILIAVSIDDWNQERKSKDLGEEYRARLISDLESDNENIRKRIEFFQNVWNYGLQAEAHLKESEVYTFEEQWDFVYASFQASQVWPFRASIITYNELQNNGIMQYLAEDSLLIQISTYYIDSPEQLKDLTGGTSDFRDFTRGVISIDIQTFIWENCFKIGRADNQTFKPCAPPLALVKITEEAYSRLRNNQDFNRLLTRRLATLYVRSLIYRNTLTENELLLSNLKGI